MKKRDESETIHCKQCGIDITNSVKNESERTPCPACGSTERLINAELKEVVAIASIGFEATQILSVERIKEEMKNENWPVAIILASTTTEMILHENLVKRLATIGGTRKKISKKLIDRWGLESYRLWCKYLEIFPKEELGELERLQKVRNEIAHTRGYFDECLNDANAIATCKEALKKSLVFLEKYNQLV